MPTPTQSNLVLWQELNEGQQESFKAGMLTEHDRIKVQFHWDRSGRSLSPGGGGVNEIRFNDGDPDRPIILR